MANAEHLEILRSGVEKWNEWRKLNQDEIIDLSGANFSNNNLSNANLSNANLSRAILHKAVLTGVMGQGAFLPFSDLFRADLSNADFTDADFSDSKLYGCDLLSTILVNTNLACTDLCYANFDGANLSNADLSEANLFKACLNGVELNGANLFGSNLTLSELVNSNFSFCRFGFTTLSQTNLSECIGLETIIASSPCTLDFHTLSASKNLPKEFLIKLGTPDQLIEYLPDFFNSSLMIYPAFLSHSWADKPFVRKLYDALAKKGVTTWLDEKKLKPGDNIHDSISEGIKYYDKLILVCSENSLNSWWVEKELEKVYEKERELQKKRGKKFRLVIPIRIDDSILTWKEGILTTVRNSVIGDFTQWQDDVAFEKAVKELVDALNANRVDVRPTSFL